MGSRVCHVNLLTWKKGTTQAEIEALCEELTKMGSEIPEVRSLSFGPDLGVMDGNVDFAIVEDFDDVDAFRRYADHPAHGQMVNEYLRPILSSRYAIQLEISE